ncbi:MAG TPA: hypothetical protein VNP98_17365 [Chthoniobacterales bacterium]|nr:hypothetical protein [Chthoniobacterales bacterium]
MFPGSEDYEDGCSPVRELTLIEQIEYWKVRARLAEECGYANLERIAEVETDDPADFWKRDDQ